MLTSRRDDGVWTWRAAGARQPKGVVEPELLPDGVSVGDVLRVEADVSVDGIAVRQVLPAKAERPAGPRVEHLGGKRFVEGVTGPARLTKEGADAGDRSRGRRGDGGRPRRDGGSGRERRDGGGRGRRDDGRGQRSGTGHRGGRGDRPQRAPRLRSGSAHRDAWLATLAPERRAVAERLANEGIRNVRQAIQAESESAGGEAKDSGGAADERLAVVEEVFSGLRAADWRDRADAARTVTDDVDLRDLRSVVAGTPERIADDEVRELADELRGKLAARVDSDHSAWIADLGSLLRKRRAVTALRVSQRPPKTGTPLPESLAAGLQEAAASQLNDEAEDDLWVRMLEAAAQSPIRLVLVAESVPPDPSERLLRTVRRFGDRLPALQAQFAAHLEPAAEEAPASAEPATEDAAAADAEPATAVEEPKSAEPAPEEEPADAEDPESSEPVAEETPAADAEPAAEVDEPASAESDAEEASPAAAPDEAAADEAPPAPEPPAEEPEDEPPAAATSAGDPPDADVAEEVGQPAGEVEGAQVGE